MHFSIAKGDNFVSGVPPSRLFKTTNLDQLSETSIYYHFFSLFGGLFGICLFEHKESGAAMLPCIIVHHPCPHPPRSTNTGDIWIQRISVRRYQEFQGWYTRTVELLDERKLRIRAGSPMKQPFEISTIPSFDYFGKKQYICSILTPPLYIKQSGYWRVMHICGRYFFVTA
jgi:hypothetical protein